jgi:hypothetical protein
MEPKFCEPEVHEAIRNDPLPLGEIWVPNGVQKMDGRPVFAYRHCLICGTDLCVPIVRLEVLRAA